ncbi:MAG: rhodanese-like domain-containing protein [Acidimicrobiales bacterium]
MILEQYQLGCLSISSYLVGDETTGKAVVVDPQRDIQIYLDTAKEKGLTIEQVILTHFHADYVSGHLELAKATGAEICFGPTAEAEFEIRNLSDNERIVLGDTVLEIWATPGHTPESISILLFEHADDSAPMSLLSGDAIFVGDVGRPDLLASIGFTAEELGRQLYDSTRRLCTLPSDTRVYPNHGAGSSCGKQLGSAPFTTIGEELRTNYALQPMEPDEFVALVTEGQNAAPNYFLHDAITNRKHHGVFDENRVVDVLTIDAAKVLAEAGAVVVDTRSPEDFAAGHLSGAINVDLDGRFAEQTGMVVGGDSDIIVAGAKGSGQEAMVRLGRIGFDNVVGSIDDYVSELEANPENRVTGERISVGALPPAGEVQLIDVRNPGETSLGFIADAHLIPLGALPNRTSELDPKQPTVIYCATGGRSSIAASWLRTQGFGDVVDVRGGYEEWSKEPADA